MAISKYCFVFLLFFSSIVPDSLASESMYWKTYAREKAGSARELQGKAKKICFPPDIHTRENLGNIVTRNTTSVCISNTLMVKQLNKEGWMLDFVKSKIVLTVIIQSTHQRLMANMLSNFVIFVSNEKLERSVNYEQLKAKTTECAHYKGSGFKPHETMQFNCKQTVEGRYFYVWGLGGSRIQSAYIEMIKIKFGIQTTTNPKGWADRADLQRDYSITFIHQSGWGLVAKGYWLVTLARQYYIQVIMIGVPKKSISILKGLLVDVGTVDSRGKGQLRGDKKSILSADKTSFMITVQMAGNSIRLKAVKNNGLMSDSDVANVEIMAKYKNEQLYFKDQVRIERSIKYEKAVVAVKIKAKVQLWFDSSTEHKGWIMVDLRHRYLLSAVDLKSGPHPKLNSDLNGVIISTSNFIPGKILSESDKLEAETCGEIGSTIKVVPNTVKRIRCMPDPALGTYVLIYNKFKAMHISALSQIVLYLKLSQVVKVVITLPNFPPIPPTPPMTKIEIYQFEVQISIVQNRIFGYWVVDLLEPRKVIAVEITSGPDSSMLTTFSVYVQDLFHEDLDEVCARFMDKSFKPNTKKYLQCIPQPITGRFVIVARPDKGYSKTAIKTIVVWFYNGNKQESTNPKHNDGITKKGSPDQSLDLDWMIIYNKLKFSSNPQGWWLFDLNSEQQVSSIIVTLTTDKKLLESFDNVYTGLMKDRKAFLHPFYCGYKSSSTLISSNVYGFYCSSLHKYRYVIVRANLECVKLDLDTINSVTIIYMKGRSSMQKVTDVSKFMLKVPETKVRYTLGKTNKYNSEGKQWYKVDLQKAVDVAMVKLDVKAKQRVSFVWIMVSNKDSIKMDGGGYNTCFYHSEKKKEVLYPGAKNFFRCSSRGLARRYLFVVTESDYLKNIQAVINISNKYQYYLWP